MQFLYSFCQVRLLFCLSVFLSLSCLSVHLDLLVSNGQLVCRFIHPFLSPSIGQSLGTLHVWCSLQSISLMSVITFYSQHAGTCASSSLTIYPDSQTINQSISQTINQSVNQSVSHHKSFIELVIQFEL